MPPTKVQDRATLGARGERAAARFLKRRGFRIVARNYNCPPGEIDIIAEDGDTLVFVEVKTRATGDRADPEVNVTAFKRRQIIAAARYFVQARRAHDRPCRFDVVSVVRPQWWRRAEIEHFPDAFSPTRG
ncbi:MAG: YraN family protein [Phycisphaerales bacterium]|nr:YraN family protein [Phycisphaerales bacterium]